MSDPAIESYRQWRQRVHERVCASNGHARSCSCPDAYTEPALREARKRATRVHERWEHAGAVQHCLDPHDSVCKAVYPHEAQ